MSYQKAIVAVIRIAILILSVILVVVLFTRWRGVDTVASSIPSSNHFILIFSPTLICQGCGLLPGIFLNTIETFSSISLLQVALQELVKLMPRLCGHDLYTYQILCAPKLIVFLCAVVNNSRRPMHTAVPSVQNLAASPLRPWLQARGEAV